MGAPHGLGAAVQIPGHGPLFAGGLGVEVHEHHVCVLALSGEDAVGLLEGGGEVAVQLKAAHEIQHADAKPLGAFKHTEAPAGEIGGEVGRAQDIGALVQVIRDLEPAPGVVAQGDDIGSGVENFIGVAGQQAQPGGVFAVDDGEVDVVFFFQSPEVVVQAVKPPLRHHVPDGKDVQQHGWASFGS